MKEETAYHGVGMQKYRINFKCFILHCTIKGNRDETTQVDKAKAAKEAQDLYQVNKTPKK